MTNRFRIAVICPLLLFVTILNGLVARQPARPVSIEPALASSVRTDDVIATTNEILHEVSELRGLKILSPVKSGVKSRKEIEEEIVRNFEESVKPEEFDAVNKTLIAYGLAPKGFKYRETMIKLLTEQVAGFYRPKSKELFIADWNPLSEQKPVMAHELTHALQDQHFNLRRFEDWPHGDSDREAAIHALIEGDATGIMYNYQLKPMKSDITRLPDIANFSELATMQAEKEDQKVFLSTPAAIREALIFPYVYGVGFVQKLVKKSGWAGVSQAFTDLPQSTEQIMHFDKYTAHERPVIIEMPDISSLLGPGWKRLDLDSNGEFGYFLILREYIGKNAARVASEGWGGDRYALYEKGEKLLLAQLSSWDTVKDADEFFQAYAERTAARYPGARESKDTAAYERDFQTDDGKTIIKQRNKSVLIIEGMPADITDRSTKLIEALWKK
ncbi:MAG: hypothetical protein J2P31_14365 [Blastocatellia bacterium]|nr:hypothetical protein [Blastocatellia bacterium]